ncbi:MAG TPA: YopX family protein [Syntrophomonas sp.]|nr:YopX family protein [Syntrophomonas sp.]
MREVRLRGKLLGKNKWLYGYYLKRWIGTAYKHYIHDGLYEYEVDPATVGQFTGLKDINGVEIYEGDILVQDCYLWFDDGRPNYRGTVEWIYSQWQVVAHCVNPNKRGISDGMNESLNDVGWNEGTNSVWEIIGNIYDNPELLGRKPC